MRLTGARCRRPAAAAAALAAGALLSLSARGDGNGCPAIAAVEAFTCPQHRHASPRAPPGGRPAGPGGRTVAMVADRGKPGRSSPFLSSGGGGGLTAAEDLPSPVSAEIIDVEALPSPAAEGREEASPDPGGAHGAAGGKGRLGSVMSEISKKIGTVDDSRVVFPEISTGEVRGLYSNLRYERSEGGKMSSNHSPGSVWAAAWLIAGTTLGAGFLALPAAVAPAGFLPSTAAMVPAYVYSGMSGLLIAELCINQMGRTGRRMYSLEDLYGEYLGRGPAALGAAAYLLLQGAVMAACISLGGAELAPLLEGAGAGGLLSPGAGSGQLLFAGAAGAVGAAVAAAGPAARDAIGSALAAAVGAALLGAIAAGAATADLQALAAPQLHHPEEVVGALPAVFLALGYQAVMPRVVGDLEGDKRRITAAVAAGTLLPFLLAVAWDAVALGNAAAAFPGGEALADPVLYLRDQGGAAGELAGAVTGLALGATLLRLVGTASESLAAALGLPRSGPGRGRGRPALALAAVAPPALWAAGHPAGFYDTLDLCGAFGISTLFLVLPSLMVWRARYGDEEAPVTVKAMVPLGKLSLGSIWKVAATLILEQGADKLGVLNWLQTHVPLPEL